MKRLFLDSEFSSLTADPKLISIALYAENGDKFYVELCDTYQRSDLSDFAAEHVEPLLQGGKYEVTWAQAKVQLREWLESQGLKYPTERMIIATDSLFWDWPWIMALLDRNYPERLITVPLVLSFNYLRDFTLFEKVLKRELAVRRQHHALDDAIANCLAWKESGGDILKDEQFDV